MARSDPKAEVGPLLREWRERRRLTQLELALDAGISTRHLSFVETGRSTPGRRTLLRIVEHLDVPFREQNRLLLAAGHAPAVPERSIDDPDLAPVRDALHSVLARHDPYPAVVFDRHWNLVTANSALLALAEGVDIDPALLEPPVNILRLGLHPRGLAPMIANLDEWRAHFSGRVERQMAITGDESLEDLLEEIAGYPAPERERDPDFDGGASDVLGPLELRAPDGSELVFLGMFASFDTPFEVTSSELAIELLFPANPATAETLQTLARDRREGRDA
jgi:transcriptional regulator with XRE-family HTH domain